MSSLKLATLGGGGETTVYWIIGDIAATSDGVIAPDATDAWGFGSSNSRQKLILG